VTALFLNHQTERCGVYQMGRRIGHTLRDAGVASYLETWDLGTALAVVQQQQPAVVIYNWHPSTLPWAPTLMARFPERKHVGLIHEIAPDAPTVGADLFRYRMICDPTFPVDGRTTFRSVRHVPRAQLETPSNDRFTVGSFGFAVGGKMFATVAHAVGAAFPGARVRLRIPSAQYGDAAGTLARQAADAARAVTVGGVSVEVEHEFLGEDALVRWIGANDLNVFFYEPNGGRGISSVIDYAIAGQRPIAVNQSQMFRHVHDVLGAWPSMSLQGALSLSKHAVPALYDAWTPERLARDYADMISALG
jgi:hypothetical protein